MTSIACVSGYGLEYPRISPRESYVIFERSGVNATRKDSCGSGVVSFQNFISGSLFNVFNVI